MSGDTVEESREDKSRQQSETAAPSPSPQLISGTQLSLSKLRKYDSLDVESAKCPGHHPHGSKQAMGWPVILALAFQSMGIVYGDIGTSPLCVYSSTFTGGIKHSDDILGVLALILYTITLIPLIKYVFIVLCATDNGDGGTFALYSLICRYARVGLIPSQQSKNQDVSNFRLELPSNCLLRASRLKSKLEKSRFAKIFLLFATMLGTSMIIGDAVLTPCISVLPAVGGVQQATSAVTEGIAVVFVMTLTSAFLVLIMIMIWKCNIFFAITYILVVGTVELLYLSSVLYKFYQGGYLPLAFATVLMTIMYVWNDVYRRKYYYELDHKMLPEKLMEIATDPAGLCHIPGLAVFYSELVQGIPPNFKHYVENVLAVHSVVFFISIKSLPISKVPS